MNNIYKSIKVLLFSVTLILLFTSCTRSEDLSRVICHVDICGRDAETPFQSITFEGKTASDALNMLSTGEFKTSDKPADPESYYIVTFEKYNENGTREENVGYYRFTVYTDDFVIANDDIKGILSGINVILNTGIAEAES